MARHTQHTIKQWLEKHWQLVAGLLLLLVILIGGVALGNALTHTTASSPTRPVATAPSFVGPSQPHTQPPMPPHTQPPARVATYEIRPGDTLWHIAQVHCGNPLKWPRLWHANMRLIVDPNLIFPKQVIQLVC